MARRGYQPEQIISKLREVEILLSTGLTWQAAARQSGVKNRPTIAGVKKMAA